MPRSSTACFLFYTVLILFVKPTSTSMSVIGEYRNEVGQQLGEMWFRSRTLGKPSSGIIEVIVRKPTYKYGVAAIVALAFCTVIVIKFVMPWYDNYSRSFQAYSPTSLPSNIHLTGHATVTVLGNGKPYKEVRIATNSPDFNILEVKTYPGEFVSKGCGSATTSDKNETDTCSNLRTPSGVPYMVQTSIYKSGVVFYQAIAWKKGSTLFAVVLYNAQARAYSSTTWGPVIDSFTRTTAYGTQRASTTDPMGGLYF